MYQDEKEGACVAYVMFISIKELDPIYTRRASI